MADAPILQVGEALPLRLGEFPRDLAEGRRLDPRHLDRCKGFQLVADQDEPLADVLPRLVLFDIFAQKTGRGTLVAVQHAVVEELPGRTRVTEFECAKTVDDGEAHGGSLETATGAGQTKTGHPSAR